MAAPLSKELRAKYNVKTMPIRRDDEILIRSGSYKGREGKVINVYRKKFKIYIEKLTREKVNGTTVNIPIRTDYVTITKLKLDKNRKAILDRKAAGRAAALGEKGKITTQEVANANAQVD